MLSSSLNQLYLASYSAHHHSRLLQFSRLPLLSIIGHYSPFVPRHCSPLPTNTSILISGHLAQQCNLNPDTLHNSQRIHITRDSLRVLAFLLVIMSDDLYSSIVKLANDGSNWVTYRDRMSWAFDSRQWTEHFTSPTTPQSYTAAGNINGQTPDQRWAAEEAMAKNVIAVSVPDHIFNQIKSKTTTMEVWNAIKAIHQTSSKIRMITENLRKKLQNTMLGDNDDPHAHFTQLTDLREQYASMGENLDDDKFAFILLCSLPSSYRDVMSTINTVTYLTETPVTPDLVIRLVTNEYDSRAIKNHSEGALSANFQKQRNKRNVECYNCRNLGHYKSDCWAKGGDKEGQRPPRRNHNAGNRTNRGRNDRNDNRNTGGRNNNRGDNRTENNHTAANAVDIEAWAAILETEDDEVTL